MCYVMAEVDGVQCADTINDLNALEPYFPPLLERHFTDGYWWIVHKGVEPAAFAGLVPFEPFKGYGFLKRCLVKPDHHGHGLQFRLMCARELKARQLGWSHLISECLACNSYSIANHRKAGFEPFEPEQPWAKDSVFWIRTL
jgi:GNAT superfamily N-acetyltransferase